MRTGRDYGTDIAIVVDKAELLHKLRSNKEKHVEDFYEAMRGFRHKSIQELDKNIADLMDSKAAYLDWNSHGKIPRADISLSAPISHERDYRRAIEMLEMDKQDTFKVDLGTYQRYVDDEWEWSEMVKMSNHSYGVG